MDFSKLGAVTITQFDNVEHPEAGMTDIVITGYIPGSEKWEHFSRKINPQPKTQSIYYGKGGEPRTEITRDPNAAEKRLKLLAAITTNVTGIDNWEFSSDNVLALFQREDCYWLVNAWEDHLNDAKKHKRPSSQESEKSASSGSTSTDG